MIFNNIFNFYNLQNQQLIIDNQNWTIYFVNSYFKKKNKIIKINNKTNQIQFIFNGEIINFNIEYIYLNEKEIDIQFNYNFNFNTNSINYELFYI